MITKLNEFKLYLESNIKRYYYLGGRMFEDPNGDWVMYNLNLSKNIKRYTPGPNGMVEYEDGDWVKYTDIK